MKKKSRVPSKIVSGGQTGADRAALDFAIEYGYDHGGWIPKGRLTESGPLDCHYQMCETQSSSYAYRTKKNVLDSDGTLIFFYDPLIGGSQLTYQSALNSQKPVCLWDLKDKNKPHDSVRKWIDDHKISVLNIAGPRASSQPKIYHAVYQSLIKLLNGPPL